MPAIQSVPENARFLAARAEELKAILPLQEECVRLPALAVGATQTPKAREWALLTAALRGSGKVAGDGIQMVAYLYILGQLPQSETISHLEVLTAYPNAEPLIEMAIKGSDLRRLIELQPQLVFYFAARPAWLRDGQEVSVSELDDERTYQVIVSELVSEGGLGWTLLHQMQTNVRPLGVTCADLVWEYLERIQSSAASLHVPQSVAV